MLGPMVLWLATAWAAPCDTGTLADALGDAERAFEQRDGGAVASATARADGHLACGSTEAIARYYRARALQAVLEGDDRALHASVAASLAAHPLLPVPPSLADPALLTAWQQEQESPPGWTTGSPALMNGLRTPLIPRTAHVGGRSGRGARVAAFGLGFVASGLYGAAWVSRKRFDASEGLPAVERLPAYRATNRLTLASLSAGVAGCTLLGVSLAL